MSYYSSTKKMVIDKVQNNKIYKGVYSFIIMENLERTLEKVEPKAKEARPLLVEKPLYEGLRKVEDKVYAGGTSIKYWM